MADDRFKDSLAGLSRALGERAASHPDPVGEAMERRAAVLAQFEKQEHQKRWLLGGAAAALASAGVTILILFLVWPPGSPSPVLPSIGAPATRAAAVVAVEPPPPPPIVVAAAPAPPPAETAEPVVVEPSVSPASVPAVSAPPAPAPAASVPPALEPPAPAPAASVPPAPAPLGRGEVREVQTLLLRFGFDPGPVDGAAGRLTEAAVAKYREQRALPQTGKPDRAVLDQLREDTAPKVDPAPQVAERPSWKEPEYREPTYREPAYVAPVPARVAPAPARQGSDFLGFLRNADNNISRWLYSLNH